MLKARVIPCLDVKDGRVVKGVQLRRPRRCRRSGRGGAAYDAAGADELCFLDITASHENRGTILDVVRRTAEHCFMPVTVGGGVRTVEDIRNLLLAGADKVSINTAAVADRALRRRARRKNSATSASSSRSMRGASPATASRRAGRSSPMAGASRPGSTRSTMRARSCRSAPAKSCSPRWTATAPRSASTSR